VSGRWRIGLAVLVVAVLAVAGVVAWVNRDEPIPTAVPAGAPKVGSCWTVDAATARGALPWPAGQVDCAQPHTAEVYHVGQVDHDLIGHARGAKGDETTIATNLMYAQARRACNAFGSTYLGADWHQDQVTLLANWINPTRDGFFACALAQSGDPGGTRYVSRTGSLKGAGGDAALAIECVRRGGGDSLAYAPCEGGHTGEFVGTYTLTPPDAPFDATAVAAAVTKGCGQQALKYLGLPADGTRPDLRVGYVGPTTASTWLGSDQTFGCYLNTEVTLRGTVRNLGTRPLPT
jgi:hypothetical protein